ncbi:MAG TPA: inositol monophosphatase family protein [Acidimicrobiales bacterium]|nr:inositol monophosphatase family protein [Acidimicrobiales bacterium]
MADLDELLQMAVAVARSAGDLLLDGLHRSRTSVRTKSSRTDMVTEMDLASESLIAASLHRQRPRDAILAEEGARQEGSTGVRWIVDPLDGTTNYLYAWPAFAVSIAAEIDGRVAAGVVHDPSHDETFVAMRGVGAWISSPGADGGPDPQGGRSPAAEDGRRPLQLDASPPLGDALVGTGFNYDATLRARQAEVLTRVLPVVRDIRRAGAAALDLCWVAAGRLDAFFEAGLQPWDWAAGALVAGESGAWVGDLEGGPPSGSMTLAAAPELAARLRALLVEAGARSAPLDTPG